MQKLLGAAVGLIAVVPSLALKVHDEQQNGTISTRFFNLAGERFDVNRPGDYELLRMPKNKSQPSTIDVRGTFRILNSTCAMQLKAVTFNGAWLGGKTVHVKSGMSIKVSTSKPPHAGSWKSFKNFTGDAPELLPETLIIRKSKEGAFEFLIGPKRAHKRPMISVTQGEMDGLDLNMREMTRLDVQELAGLLGTDKHDKSSEVHTQECESKSMLVAAPVGSSHCTASWHA